MLSELVESNESNHVVVPSGEQESSDNSTLMKPFPGDLANVLFLRQMFFNKVAYFTQAGEEQEQQQQEQPSEYNNSNILFGRNPYLTFSKESDNSTSAATADAKQIVAKTKIPEAQFKSLMEVQAYVREHFPNGDEGDRLLSRKNRETLCAIQDFLKPGSFLHLCAGVVFDISEDPVCSIKPRALPPWIRWGVVSIEIT